MLNSDRKKLRFLGIDLHSRTRRRWAVALTMAVFLIAMVGLSIGIEIFPALQRYHCGVLLMLAVSGVFSFGIFREGGPVKAFNEPIWRLKGMDGGAVLVRSLDELAEYRFGGRFEALPEAQQTEVLRAYRVGNYFYPAASSKAPSRMDERERIEKDRANSATLASLTRYLFIMAGVYGFSKRGLDPSVIAALLLTLAFWGLNGPNSLERACAPCRR